MLQAGVEAGVTVRTAAGAQKTAGRQKCAQKKAAAESILASSGRQTAGQVCPERAYKRTNGGSEAEAGRQVEEAGSVLPTAEGWQSDPRQEMQQWHPSVKWQACSRHMQEGVVAVHSS